MAFLHSSYVFRSSLRHDSASAVAAFGPHINKIVCRLYNVEVVFNNHHGVAAINKTLQHNEKLAHIIKVQEAKIQSLERENSELKQALEAALQREAASRQTGDAP